LRNHELRVVGPIGPNRIAIPSPQPERAQAAVASFFCGYRRRAPTRLHDDGLVAQLKDWRAAAGILASAASDLLALTTRCDPGEIRTPAGRLAPACVRCLRSLGCDAVAAQVVAVIPEPDGDEGETEQRVFGLIEAVVRAGVRDDPDCLARALTCLRFDRDIALLAAERRQMRSSGPTDTSAEHWHQLRRTAGRRRATLAPNHVWVDAALAPLLTGTCPPEHVQALLYFAHPAGIKFLSLEAAEVLILTACDGRSLDEVGDELAAATGLDVGLARSAVVELLVRLSSESVQLVEWSN
jgi:hypothetical protein